MAFEIWEAAIIALYYWFCWWDISHPFSGVAWLQDCVWVGVLMGLVFGDVQTGLMVGGTLALTFVCALPVGANLPVDYAAAALAAVPMAIKFGWSAGVAISISVLFGMLGAKLDRYRRIIASKYNDSARTHIVGRNYHLLVFDAILHPIAKQFLIRAIPMFLVIFFGGTALNTLISLLPNWAVHALDVAGGVLPGLGVALCLNTIGRSKQFPFFVVGFVCAAIININILIYAAVALCIAAVYVKLTQKTDSESGGPIFARQKLEPRSELSVSDHFRGYARFAFWHRCSQAMDTFYGTGMAFSYKNVLRKIYRDDELYQEAMSRHLEPFIPEVIWGSSILGIVVDKEEARARGEEVTPASISALKTSLMGPIAGFGDAINYMVFWNMLKVIFYPLAAAGSFLGMTTPVILHITLETVGWKAYKMGYSGGPPALIALLKSNLKNNIMVGAGVMGFFLLGTISFTHVALSLSAALTADWAPMAEAITRALLSFAAVSGCYIYLRMGGKFLRMMIYCILLALVLSLFKIV